MRKLFLLLSVMFVVSLGSYSLLISNPNDNGSNPGCTCSGDVLACHDYQDGIIANVTQLGGLAVEITIEGVTPGRSVAGELVDQNGQVVAVENSTDNNPFVLTAPEAGRYLINAGFRRPDKMWDSLTVVIDAVSGTEPPVSSHPVRQFDLYPNHPNPFNPETTIRFSLPQPGMVNVTVYNIRGQVVRNLTQNYLQTGLHSVRWNGRDNNGQTSPSGVYFAEVQFDGQRLVRKMTMTK